MIALLMAAVVVAQPAVVPPPEAGQAETARVSVDRHAWDILTNYVSDVQHIWSPDKPALIANMAWAVADLPDPPVPATQAGRPAMTFTNGLWPTNLLALWPGNPAMAGGIVGDEIKYRTPVPMSMWEVPAQPEPDGTEWSPAVWRMQDGRWQLRYLGRLVCPPGSQVTQQIQVALYEDYIRAKNGPEPWVLWVTNGTPNVEIYSGTNARPRKGKLFTYNSTTKRWWSTNDPEPGVGLTNTPAPFGTDLLVDLSAYRSVTVTWPSNQAPAWQHQRAGVRLVAGRGSRQTNEAARVVLSNLVATGNSGPFQVTNGQVVAVPLVPETNGWSTFYVPASGSGLRNHSGDPNWMPLPPRPAPMLGLPLVVLGTNVVTNISGAYLLLTSPPQERPATTNYVTNFSLGLRNGTNQLELLTIPLK